MSHRISVFGLGYVGSVSAACLAGLGHRVVGVDVNPGKVELVASGRSPVVEPEVEELSAAAHQAGLLTATRDSALAIRESDVTFICVGTPSLPNGKLDLTAVEHVAAEIGKALAHKTAFHTVVLRSTVLPGTTDKVVVPALEISSGKRAGVDFAVCFNPEFMREGTAVADFRQPPHTVVGAANPEHARPLKEIYGFATSAFYQVEIPVAEAVKYVANAFHALKVTFINEIGTLCKQFGADAAAVSEIFCADTRLNISPAYLKPGFAFGGSCLPKDVRALAYAGRQFDLKLPLLEAILPSNERHIDRVVEQVLATGKRKLALIGLSFKAGTDDLRESPQVQVVKRLLGEGFSIQIFDDKVALGRLVGSNRQYIEQLIPHVGELLRPDLEAVVGAAEVVLLGTNVVARERLAALLRSDQVLIDLVNLDRSRRPQVKAAYQGVCW